VAATFPEPASVGNRSGSQAACRKSFLLRDDLTYIAGDALHRDEVNPGIIVELGGKQTILLRMARAVEKARNSLSL
jgi:hypothetical protein